MVETPRLDVVLRFSRRFLLSRGRARRLLVLVAWASLWATRAGAQPDAFVPHQVIVKFKSSTSPADASDLRSSVNATVTRRFATIGAELWDVAGIGVPGAIERLKLDRRVVYAEPNYIVHAEDVFPDDPRFPDMWNLHNIGQTGGSPDADIDAPEAWTFETGGNVLVGVIDTGVDWKHVDLAGNIFVNPREIPDNHVDDDDNGYVDDVRGWDFVNEDNNPDDDNGHGTHVAGTIAALGNNGVGIAGVSWSARILPLKFLSAIGSGSTADAIRAVEYATAMGARLTNNSWGGIPFSQALSDAIKAAGDANILFVAAAGNASLNSDVTPHYPSGFALDNIIAVASTDDEDRLSVFSNFGKVSVDMAAPGTDIISLFPGDRYAIASGTSMAAPHVAGAVCLLWSADPSLTFREVKDAILSSADRLPSLLNITVSGGRLNLNAMLARLDDVAPAAVGDLSVQSMGSNTARLQWTASGDDGLERTATRYDLRYSTAPINLDNFDAATTVAGMSKPKPPGSPESFVVARLDFDTTYYFALVVEDDQGNRSPVSNAVSGTTLGVPGLELSPVTFATSLLTGGRSVQTLAIRNTAQGTLDFTFAGASVGRIVDGAAPTWLRVDPLMASVPAGSVVNVDIGVDATRMPAGDHLATLDLRTNDPSQPTSPVVVTLRVTDAPDLAVLPPALAFGVHYTSTCATDTVVISNIGAVALVVSGVSTVGSEFVSDPGGFVLDVDESRAVAVTYCPHTDEVTSTPRPSAGELVIASNDPDHPTVSVPLSGAALDPPVVAVTPPSFAENMVTGETVTRTLTVTNLGASNLDFEIALEELGGGSERVDVIADPSLAADVVAVGRPLSSDQLATLTTSVPQSLRVGARGPIDRGQPSRPHAAHPQVLERVSTQGLEQVFGSDANEFLGGPRTRGNIFACTTPTTLLEHRFYMNPSAPTQVWFVVYEGDEEAGVYQLISASNVTPAGPGLGWYSSGRVSVQLRAGKFYLIATAFEAPTTYYNAQNIAPYPVPTSFGRLTAAAGWTWAPVDQFPPAPFQFVAPEAFLEPVAYYQTLVTGSAIRWLSLGPEDGSLPPAASLDVTVSFDATGVAGGDYDANLHLTSNDPTTPAVVIPAHVHVTGAPDITVADTHLDFGTTFVGTSAQDTLVISNTGTDFLFVPAITSSNPDYSVDASGFALVPGTRKLVVVTFAPTSAGTLPATLSIASNDPDEGVVVIALTGEGRAAPVVSVSPASLSVDIASGEASTPVLSLSNSGGSDLEFEIDTRLNGSRSVATRISIPRSTGDFPRGEEAVSIGRAPVRGARDVPFDLDPASIAVPGGRAAFATETQNRQAARVDLDAPERLELTGFAPDFIWAGDFGVGDNSFAYAINELNQFMKIDTLTGAQTPLGTLSPQGTEVWSGMALDPTDGTMYATTTDANTSSLYVIDVDVPSATRVGSIFFHGIVALAVDDDGAMYGLDVIADELVSIDKATGQGTTIGSLGFDSNFGQGMAFDPESEQLYISAFNNFRFQSELRVADRTTGATAVVGVLGGLDPGGLVQLGWLAIPGLGGVPWLRANPRRGVVPPGATLDVAVHFDATSQNGGDYDAGLRIATNDPAALEITVPAHMHVTGVPEIAVSPSALEFGVVFIGTFAKRVLAVSNAGTDVLHVSAVTADGDYVVDGTAFALAPGEERDLAVTLTPTSTGAVVGTLSLESDDVDEGTLEVSLSAEAREPPVMSVTPTSFEENLLTGERVARPMTIDNTAGASDLVWNATTRVAGDTRTIVATSPTHSGHPAFDPHKNAGRPPLARPDAGAIFSFDAHAASPPSRVDGTTLETMLASLDARFGDVTAVIPNRWDFFDGEVSDGILDGGYDMFDGGNYLSTNFGGFIPYSNGVITTGSFFGASGRYFTRKYPGLFVLVADLDGVDTFEIDGNLGADGQGSVDGAILDVRTAGASFRGFVKRVFGAGDPSVNHLVIVESNDAATHEFATDTNSDYQRVSNLAASRRVYYILYAGWDGAYIDNGATLNIMAQFLDALGLSPQWAHVTPGSGVVPAGATSTVGVAFDATGLVGDYDAQVVVAGNDPITPEIVLPVALHVAPAPDIALSNFVLNYAPAFVGVAASDTLVVSNLGTYGLTVTSIASNLPDFTVDMASFALAPGQEQVVLVSFTPTESGQRSGVLSVTSNDPDEGVAPVLLIGTGLEAPAVSVDPTSLADTLAVGATSNRLLRVSNTGGNALDLRITVEGARPGGIQSAGGGPDYFGYRWEDNTDPNGPALEWIDVSGGTDIVLGGDDFVTGIPLGFAFGYYGLEFSTIGVGSNGWLSFTGSSGAYPTSVPQPDFYAGAIAPYARDLLPPSAAYVRYRTMGVAPDRRFVVEYNQIPDVDASHPKTFEVVLYERTHAIRFQYLTAPNAPEGFGIESADESLGLGNGGTGDLFIDPARVGDGYAIEFIAPPGWLHVEPAELSIPPSTSADVTVTINAAQLAGGNYDARVSIRSNDPAAPLVTVPVSLSVEAARSLAGAEPRVVPSRYALYDNRPNPFNPVTTIAYDLPRDGRVRLTIYDVRGRPVKDLVNASSQPAGRHSTTWDGRNQRGEPVASGVYFYRLTVGDFVQTKKMVLLK